MSLSTIAKSIWNVSRQPRLLMPHAVYNSFDLLPVPLSTAFPLSDRQKSADIRAVVLDKDNCFALAGTNTVFPSNQRKFQDLIDFYSSKNILIVSNSSGFSAADVTGQKAAALEKATNVKVLRHSLRKPACGPEILEYFRDTITSPSQICVIGDRLFTDVLMASQMRSRAIWIKKGVDVDHGALTRIEMGLFGLLSKRGAVPL